MSTAFFWDEKCFWHGGGDYAFMAPVGGFVQPMAGGLPENPETKRRLVNLLRVSGLWSELTTLSAAAVTDEDLLRVHPKGFLQDFKDTAKAGGGELGLRAPFGRDGFEIASLSAGLTKGALFAVLRGEADNAYALSRPPGHHCMPDWQNGFCLLANIGIAIKAAQAAGLCQRVAVLDWDVHHGNGTEAIFYDRDDVLTISMHQERNYPLDTGAFSDRGTGAGHGYNLNIPLPPGSGHKTWLSAFERLAAPALSEFQPDVIIIACGFDAAAFDPLSRTMCTAATFRDLTKRVKTLAGDLCDGRLMMAHEGGYSELYVPFCGHAVLSEMAGSAIDVPDPFADTLIKRQPDRRFDAFCDTLIDEMVAALS